MRRARDMQHAKHWKCFDFWISSRSKQSHFGKFVYRERNFNNPKYFRPPINSLLLPSTSADFNLKPATRNIFIEESAFNFHGKSFKVHWLGFSAAQVLNKWLYFQIFLFRKWIVFQPRRAWTCEIFPKSTTLAAAELHDTLMGAIKICLMNLPIMFALVTSFQPPSDLINYWVSAEIAARIIHAREATPAAV